MKRTVARAHEASYPDPIHVTRGDKLVPTGREETWEGHRWLWAIAEDGREGWVPADLPRHENKHLIASYDYSARELTVATDEIVEVLAVSHGWVWCRRTSEEEGWIPESATFCIQRGPTPTQ